MKPLYIFSLFAILLFASCSKRNHYVEDEYDWMRNHEPGSVAYVDYYTGNYIVETYRGFTVVESFDGTAPRKFDDTYPDFSSRGVRTIYNYSGNYFGQGRVIDYWLTWSDAMYVLDEISY